MNIVTIMNYPDEKQYNKMCRLFLYSVLKHNPDCNMFILHDKNQKLSQNILNFINKKFKNSSINIIGRNNHPQPFINTHNIRFKLFNLCKIKEPFIFLDADIVCFNKLDYLWNLRTTQPFISINHQLIPKHTDRYEHRFINSGVQVVGDPEWYNWDEMSTIHTKLKGKYSVPGYDQAVIYEYCKSINYDYTHPLITPAWNSCAGYTKIIKNDNEFIPRWIGPSHIDELPNYEVYINHYWDNFKPWNINCPVYKNFNEND